MNFYVGQKVVCVKSGWFGLTSAGKTYTVSDVSNCGCGPSLLLVGVENSPGRCGTTCKCGYEWLVGKWNDAARFRPIDDLTASLARTESERIVEERPDHVNVPQTV